MNKKEGAKKIIPCVRIKQELNQQIRIFRILELVFIIVAIAALPISIINSAVVFKLLYIKMIYFNVISTATIGLFAAMLILAFLFKLLLGYQLKYQSGIMLH